MTGVADRWRRVPGPRVAATALLLAVGLATTGCGAGYGEPVSSGDDGAQPAAQTQASTPAGTPGTPGATSGTTTGGTPAGGGQTTTGTTTATTSTGGQGSGNQGSGSDAAAAALTAYAQATNGYCSGLTAAGNAFNQAAKNLAGATGAAALRGAGRGIVAFSDSLKRATAGLRAATPPAAYRRFHSATLNAVSKMTSAVDAARGRLLAGDAGAMQSVGTKVSGLQSASGSVRVPSALARKAPACRAFAG